MPRYKLVVAYDGTNFHGWQKQRKDIDRVMSALPPDATSLEIALAAEEARYIERSTVGDTTHYVSRQVRTIQAELESAVQIVVREPVQVVGASRTDAGVHARGQVAAFTTAQQIPVEKLPRAITSRLADDVQVLHAEIVPDDFDPIRGAIAKGYCFRLAHSCARHRRPLFDRHFVTHTAYRLDVARMNEAARLFLGEHNFESFARISHGRESTVRSIYECKVTATRQTRCHIDVAGNGFLYNMVRIIAGTLVEVGRGALEPDAIPTILAAKNRRAAGPTLPPNGLCLMWIKYPQAHSA
jgi:tRNA pseudouridine38-40 synthase